MVAPTGLYSPTAVAHLPSGSSIRGTDREQLRVTCEESLSRDPSAWEGRVHDVYPLIFVVYTSINENYGVFLIGQSTT